MSGTVRWADERLGLRITSLTLGGLLSQRAREKGGKVFLSYLPDGRRYTYAQLDELSSRAAGGLAALGVARGQAVAILMENSPEFLIAFFAIAKLGAVAVPANTALRGALLGHLLADAGCVAAVVDAELAGRIEELRAAVPELRLLVVHGGPADGAVPFERLLEGEAPAEPPQVLFSDLAGILYTSGTTGASKGVTFTQARSLLWGMSHIEAFGYREDDVYYVCLPLFHVNGLHGSTLNALVRGASVALTRRFSASAFWGDLARSGATVTNMLGSMVNILWSRPPAAEDRGHRLRMVQATPVPEFARAFEARFGMRFISGFGLTDFGPSHAWSLEHRADKLGSCGTARRGIEARVVDANDFDVAEGEVGELVLRSNNPWESGGYYRNPEATLAAWRNGWFHTGDRGFVDADGYFWFADRAKDSIRRRGENISAYEVEQAILAHPDVADAAVYAVRSEMSEDEVAASVVLRPGAAPDPEALVRFCARNLASFMVPRYIAFAEDLPRNPSQKVEKFRLREAAEANRNAFWDRERAGVAIAR